jgi:hypothetical protein
MSQDIEKHPAQIANMGTGTGWYSLPAGGRAATTHTRHVNAPVHLARTAYARPHFPPQAKRPRRAGQRPWEGALPPRTTYNRTPHHRATPPPSPSRRLPVSVQIRNKRGLPPPGPGPWPLVAKRPRGERARPLAVPRVGSRPGAPPQWAPWAGREDAEPEPEPDPSRFSPLLITWQLVPVRG